MASTSTYRVRLYRRVFEKVELSDSDVLTIAGVAAALGVTVRTIRGWIKSGEFPQSHIQKGQTAYWQRQFVRTWQAESLTIGHRKARGRRYPDLDTIDREDERDFSRKDIKAQAIIRGYEEMKMLLNDDPVEFARQYPSLKPWLKDKKLLP